MLKDDIVRFLRIGILPGTIWNISAYEAHCIFTALKQVYLYFNNEDDVFLIWHKIFENETQIEATPTEYDRIFFEILLKAERARLSWHKPQKPCSECGQTVYDHENAIRAFLEREIEMPKNFAHSRRILEELPPGEKIHGLKCLSRQDAEKIIEQEIQRLNIRLIAGDQKILSELAQTSPTSSLSEKIGVDDTPLTHKNTLEGAREQLWEILEKYLLD